MVRDQIIDAAAAVFSQKGYHPASMDAIAQTAGVAKGSLYYHFHSKSDLFTAVVCEGIADMRRQVDTIMAANTGIQEIFTAVADSLLRALRRLSGPGRPDHRRTDQRIGSGNT